MRSSWGAPAVMVPGLIEIDGGRAGEGLYRGATLDDDSPAGSTRHPGDDRDRGGEEQRTGRGDDENRERAVRGPRGNPRSAGNEQRRRHEPGGVAVGEALQRSFRAARRLDHADDAGVGALCGGGRSAELKRAAAIDDTAADRLVGEPFDGARLTGEGGLVQRDDGIEDDAIDRDDVPAVDHHHIAGRDGIDGHGLDGAVDQSPGKAGSTLEE